jgi:glyoxalase family protein
MTFHQMSILGIHHITALASDPQRNLDFYGAFLGLRLVKQTVNFDAPDVYHLYYGDETGRPGTILTFFPFPDADPGKRGAGEISAVAFMMPPGAMAFWAERLSAKGLSFDGPRERHGQQYLSFADPDGMRIELFEEERAAAMPAWGAGPVETPFALRALHGVTLLHRSAARTSALLTVGMGFSPEGSAEGRQRFTVGSGNDRAILDIVEDPAAPAARQSAGSVHHIAWRVGSDAEQGEWRRSLTKAGVTPTEVIDRQYFRSLYFREPAGVLFEIATDPPGFTIDETVESLGSRLKLPPWLEAERPLIEQRLPPLTVEAAGS